MPVLRQEASVLRHPWPWRLSQRGPVSRPPLYAQAEQLACRAPRVTKWMDKELVWLSFQCEPRALDTLDLLLGFLLKLKLPLLGKPVVLCHTKEGLTVDLWWARNASL